MSLRVLGRASSINVRKVLWTCAELDLPVEHVESDPQLLARNPNGKVPVMDDGGFVLWESNAICRYLAGRQKRRSLLPEDAEARALVEQWMDWQATDLNVAWSYAFLAMRMLDDRLQQGGQFITGEFFTLADIGLGLSTHRWLLSPIERPPLDALLGYYQRLSVRPAFRSQVDPHVP